MLVKYKGRYYIGTILYHHAFNNVFVTCSRPQRGSRARLISGLQHARPLGFPMTLFNARRSFPIALPIASQSEVLKEAPRLPVTKCHSVLSLSYACPERVLANDYFSTEDSAKSGRFSSKTFFVENYLRSGRQSDSQCRLSH